MKSTTKKHDDEAPVTYQKTSDTFISHVVLGGGAGVLFIGVAFCMGSFSANVIGGRVI